jgi:hypothetical protein
MDQIDREKYASAYRLLADVLGRDRPVDAHEDHVSFNLGDLTRRVFVEGAHFLPPQELLEHVAETLRTGDPAQWKLTAVHLREHAKHLEDWHAAAPTRDADSQ